MKKPLITLSMALAALFASNAFAQTPGPGQDRAVDSKKATAAEKEAAKKARKAEGSAAAKADQPGEDKPGTAAARTKLSPTEKAEASAKRKQAGAAESKSPKDKSGPAS